MDLENSISLLTNSAFKTNVSLFSLKMSTMRIDENNSLFLSLVFLVLTIEIIFKAVKLLKIVQNTHKCFRRSVIFVAGRPAHTLTENPLSTC